MDPSFIFLNNSCEIYSIPKESMYAGAFLSMNNKTNVFFYFVSRRDLCNMLHILFQVNYLLKRTIKPKLLIGIPINFDIPRVKLETEAKLKNLSISFSCSCDSFSQNFIVKDNVKCGRNQLSCPFQIQHFSLKKSTVVSMKNSQILSMKKSLSEQL